MSRVRERMRGMLVSVEREGARGVREREGGRYKSGSEKQGGRFESVEQLKESAAIEQRTLGVVLASSSRPALSSFN